MSVYDFQFYFIAYFNRVTFRRFSTRSEYANNLMPKVKELCNNDLKVARQVIDYVYGKYDTKYRGWDLRLFLSDFEYWYEQYVASKVK